MAKMTVSTSSRRLLPVPLSFCVAVGFHEDVIFELDLCQFAVFVPDHLDGRCQEFEAKTRVRYSGERFREGFQD